MKMNGKTLYYHYNAHGDVIALTDEAGKIVAEYAYDAWGNVLKNTTSTEEAKANPYGYAGYTYDKEIEQYYLMARYYEPVQGVFTAYDPDPGDEDDPQTMNGYNYVGNNPVNKIDPDGKFWQYATAAGIGAVVGAGRYYIENKLRGKKSTWKGAGKAALYGAGNGLMWTGAGRVFGFVSKGKAVLRAVKTKRPLKNIGQYTRHICRFVTKPVKHLKKTPVRRLKGIQKARMNSTKAKLVRMSNAIQRHR
ncbi:RHS repeat-associated core domain-containing protein [Listeria monocytogenes]|nr:RHS repeat-associated core domain-containing protein [Listeria monocytogenes]